jgi:hypothetical protein
MRGAFSFPRVPPLTPIPLIGRGVSVWTRSLWWLLAGYLLEILREPLRAFLLEIAKQTGSAIGKRLAQRLRQSRRGKRRSSRR